MISELLFYLVVLLANAVQAATGFAGSMLAMAPSLKLLGADTAKPLLTVIALLVSLAVSVQARRQIDRRIFLRFAGCMLAGLLAGMALAQWVTFESILPFYGAFLIAYALYRLFSRRTIRSIPLWAGILILIAAGMLQALFLAGGALLVIYASVVLPEKDRFRATISPVWVLLNTILIVQYALNGQFTPDVLRIGAVALIPLACGVLLGNFLHNKIGQTLFMRICFALLLFNGIWVLVG